MIPRNRLLHSLALLMLTALSSLDMAAMIQLLKKAQTAVAVHKNNPCSFTTLRKHQPRNPGLDLTGQFLKQQEIFPLFQKLQVTSGPFTAPWTKALLQISPELQNTFPTLHHFKPICMTSKLSLISPRGFIHEKDLSLPAEGMMMLHTALRATHH